MLFADKDWNHNFLRVEIYIFIFFAKTVLWAIIYIDQTYIPNQINQHFNATKIAEVQNVQATKDEAAMNPEYNSSWGGASKIAINTLSNKPGLALLSRLKPPFDISIVIPYRNRAVQLAKFLVEMEEYTTGQGIDPMFVIVEQTEKQLFNRGKLLNIGFLETKKLANVGCYMFHDVDILPTHGSNCDYSCYRDVGGNSHPRAFAVYLSKWNYEHQSWPGFGGVTQMTEKHMLSTNGNPNRFYGWGGEDGVMYVRLLKAGLIRSEVPKTCRFDADQHDHDAGNAERANYHKWVNRELKKENRRWPSAVSDGLSTIEYNVTNLEKLSYNVFKITVEI